MGGGFLLLLKQFDIISQKPTLLINNSDRNRSVYGAFLTILLCILTLYFGLVSLSELFGRGNPNFVISKKLPEMKLNLTLNEFFPLFVSIDNRQGVNMNKYFTYSLMVDMVASKSAIAPCNMSEDINIVLSNSPFQNKTNFQCLNMNDITIANNLYFKINLCTQGATGCELPTNQTLANLKDVIVSFIFMDNLIDIHDVIRPAKILRIPQIITQKLSPNIKTQINMKLKQEQYSTDYGYIFTDIDMYELLTIDKNIYPEFEIRQNDPEVLAINIWNNFPYIKNYERNFYKGQRFFAEIGGVFNFLYLIAINLNMVYSIVHFYMTIDSSCMLSYYTEKVLILKIK
jgi:hypothetical protein